MKPQLRGTAVPHDLDVAPENAARVPGPKRLHGRFFCGEASGKMNRGDAASGAVRDFSVSKDTMEEPLAVSLDGVGDTVDVSGIESESDDIRHASPA